MDLLTDLKFKTPRASAPWSFLQSWREGGRHRKVLIPITTRAPASPVFPFTFSSGVSPRQGPIFGSAAAAWTFWDEHLEKVRFSPEGWESQSETSYWPGQMMLKVCHWVPGLSWFFRVRVWGHVLPLNCMGAAVSITTEPVRVSRSMHFT